MTDQLRAAAARRRQDAEGRVARALRTMSRAGEAINFAAVARKAAVSTDFLYRHPGFRAQGENLRLRRLLGNTLDSS